MGAWVIIKVTVVCIDPPPVQMVLMTADEVRVAIRQVEETDPEYRRVLVMAAPSASGGAESSQPAAIPTMEGVRGELSEPEFEAAKVVGEHLVDADVVHLGLDNRGQLRRLQDFLWQEGNLTPNPVSVQIMLYGS